LDRRINWISKTSVLSLTDLQKSKIMGLIFPQITPSEKLEWHPCYGDSFKCARLTVAMDYHRPLNASSSHPKVHVALLLVPGAGKKPSTSPLLLNPGGPGGSGVFIALALGRNLQTILGADQDIIGFDPRGVGATTPRTDCFGFPSYAGGEDDYVEGQFHRTLWQVSGREIGLVNSSEVALQKVDTRARALGQQCGSKDSLNGNDSIFKYVSTPNVARDMISIIDAWDQWRGDETETDTAAVSDEDNEADSSEQTHALDTKGKLVYWGFSYGVGHCPSSLIVNLYMSRLFSEPHSPQCSQTVLVELCLMVLSMRTTTSHLHGQTASAMQTPS